MSLNNAIRSSDLYQRVSDVPPNHHLRKRAKLYPYPYIFPPRFVMDYFDWALFHHVILLLSCLGLVQMTISLFLQNDKGDATFWVFAPTMTCMILMTMTAPISVATRRFLQRLSQHFGVDDLGLVIKLSPSQFDDLCIKRLQTLASELEEVEKHTKPFDKERLDARSKFSSAFNFFKDQGFIKGDWDPFFPQLKTQK